MSELFDQQDVPGSVLLPPSRLRIVPIDEALSQHLAQPYWDWRTLFERDPQASPLQHADHVLAELAGGRISSPFDPVLVCDDQPGDSKSIAILVPKTVRTPQVGGLGPGWALQGLRLAGGRFLCEAESADQQARMLQVVTRHCMEVGAAFLLIEDLDEASRLHDAVENESVHGCRLFTTRDIQPRRYINLPPDEAEYWKTFTSLSLRKHRAKVRKAGRTRLDRVTEIDQIPEFLRAAHEISRQSWQSQQFGLRVRDDEAELRQFTALAQHGLLRCYVWWVEDQPAAFAICNQYRGCLRYEETAFCAQYRNISAGHTMLHLIVEDLYRHNPPRCVDFGGGDSEYKQHFANYASRSRTVWLVPPTWPAALTLSYLNACRRVRAGFRAVVKASGWGTRARQWIRFRNAPVQQSNDTSESLQLQTTDNPD